MKSENPILFPECFTLLTSFYYQVVSKLFGIIEEHINTRSDLDFRYFKNKVFCFSRDNIKATNEVDANTKSVLI